MLVLADPFCGCPSANVQLIQVSGSCEFSLCWLKWLLHKREMLLNLHLWSCVHVHVYAYVYAYVGASVLFFPCAPFSFPFGLALGCSTSFENLDSKYIRPFFTAANDSPLRPAKSKSFKQYASH